jgi:hypothetical protein
MSGIWMYIHVGSMDVHSCREYGCTFMSEKIGGIDVHVGIMDVHSCWEDGCLGSDSPCIHFGICLCVIIIIVLL